MAGKLGANLLTHLLGQSIEEVAEKVAIYRKARREAGHRGRGRVALMLHTFVGDSLEAVKATVRQPMIEAARCQTTLTEAAVIEHWCSAETLRQVAAFADKAIKRRD